MTMNAKAVNLGNRTGDLLMVEGKEWNGKSTLLTVGRGECAKLNNFIAHSREAAIKKPLYIWCESGPEDAWAGEMELVVKDRQEGE